MQKLPRSLEIDLEYETKFQALMSSAKQLPDHEAMGQIIQVDLSDNLIRALAFARRCGSLQRGLENIATLLQTEQTGLNALFARGKAQDSERISRVFLFANDGSPRFYYQCESLLRRYKNRVLGLKVNAHSSELGSTFFGKEKVAKALLVSHRDAVVKVLSAIMQQP